METKTTEAKKKFKKMLSAIILAIAIIAGVYINDSQQQTSLEAPPQISGKTITEAKNSELAKYKTAAEALAILAVKGRAPKTGYERDQFGNGWAQDGTCDTRNRILARDLTNKTFAEDNCLVLSGRLQDPYTGKTKLFARGENTSAAVQIDHVVALSDAWQKGAQQLSPALRIQFANDGLNLLAVDGPANQNKGDGDAATWLPSYKPIRCAYVARQISVKVKYSLWVTAAEKKAMHNILQKCPDEKVPR